MTETIATDVCLFDYYVGAYTPGYINVKVGIDEGSPIKEMFNYHKQHGGQFQITLVKNGHRYPWEEE